MKRRAVAAVCCAWMCLVSVGAQQRALTEAQLKSAAGEVPRLVEVLSLEPGMTVADVGAGFGAWTMQFSRAVGPMGRVYATDIGAPQLAALREAVEQKQLANVIVVEGATEATNLPDGCCDAVLMRDAYHHLTQPDAMVRSLAAALKPGGRLAVIDFPPRPDSNVPDGVLADREGHGVPPGIVEREVGVALVHVRTILNWAPNSQPASLFLALFRKP